MVGRGVEVELRIGHRVAAVVEVEDALKVADPHVVGLEREIGAPQVSLGDPQVADGGGQCLRRVEAVVDLGPGSLEARLDTGLAPRRRQEDPAGELAAAGQVDVHAEERGPGLGQDLGQSRGVGRIVPHDHVGAARALDEHERLDQARVEPGAGDGAIDHRAPPRDAGRRGQHPAGALGVQDVLRAGDRPGHELRLAAGHVRERITRLGRLPDARERQRGWPRPSA